MKKSAALVLVGFAVFAAAAVASTTRAPSVAVPRAAKAPAKAVGPLLAVVPGARGPVLGRADKRAIWIARRSPKLRIFNPLQAWAYRPDGSALALATHPETSGGGAKVQFVDSRSVRRIATTRLPWGDVRALGWGSGRVNVVLQDWDAGELRILSIDGTKFRVVARRTLQRKVFAVDRIGQALVLLTGPQRGIGTAGLVVVDPDGSLRSVALPETSAGMDMPNETEPSDLSKVHQNIPGLAVDPASDRAFVVPASGPVAEISLATLVVSYHSLAASVSLLGRLHDWVEPKAEAKGVNGPTRTAQWLGNGVVGVTGGDETATLDGNKELHASWSPAGLTLIDTNTWGTRVIDRGADSFTVDGDTMLVTGAKWDDSARSGMGLAAYSFDGSRKLSVLRGDAAYLMLAWRGKAYLGLDGSNSATIVDLSAGKVVGARSAPLAQLLIKDGSN
jgi:hypothetical protein